MVRFAAALLRQVSLFTREWIEIPTVLLQIYPCCCVSLFTREWIEMYGRLCCKYSRQSLPLYEGVDWNPLCKSFFIPYNRSPSLRGSGLKYKILTWQIARDVRLPLYEGVDWNKILMHKMQGFFVSLFTREWIEIMFVKIA